MPSAEGLAEVLSTCQDRKREGDLLYGTGRFEEASAVYSDANALLELPNAESGFLPRPPTHARLSIGLCIDLSVGWCAYFSVRRPSVVCLSVCQSVCLRETGSKTEGETKNRKGVEKDRQREKMRE